MTTSSDPVAYFGRQVRKARLSHGWSLHEFGQQIVYHPAALLRGIGSPEIMAGQMRHLRAVATMPRITVQVVPAVAHAGLLGGVAVTDKAAYAESVVRGQVFEDDETISALSVRFDTLRGSACSVSDSISLMEQAEGLWTGVSRATARTADRTVRRQPRRPDVS
jgi:Domain of unknown function (DUF5753)